MNAHAPTASVAASTITPAHPPGGSSSTASATVLTAFQRYPPRSSVRASSGATDAPYTARRSDAVLSATVTTTSGSG